MRDDIWTKHLGPDAAGPDEPDEPPVEELTSAELIFDDPVAAGDRADSGEPAPETSGELARPRAQGEVSSVELHNTWLRSAQLDEQLDELPSASVAGSEPPGPATSPSVAPVMMPIEPPDEIGQGDWQPGNARRRLGLVVAAILVLAVFLDVVGLLVPAIARAPRRASGQVTDKLVQVSLGAQPGRSEVGPGPAPGSVSRIKLSAGPFVAVQGGAGSVSNAWGDGGRGAWLSRAAEQAAPQSEPDVPVVSYDPDEIRRALAAAAVLANQQCFTWRTPRVASVAVTFAPSGRVTEAVVTDGQWAATTEGNCIARVLRTAKISAFQGGLVVIHEPLALP